MFILSYTKEIKQNPLLPSTFPWNTGVSSGLYHLSNLCMYSSGNLIQIVSGLKPLFFISSPTYSLSSGSMLPTAY